MAKKKTDEEFRRVFDKYKDEYAVSLDGDIDFSCKMLFTHKCGWTFKEFPGKVINNKLSCTLCDGRVEKQDNEFIDKMEEKLGNDYKLIGHYKGKGEKVTIKHLTCGNTYLVETHNVLKGHKCPYCVGERISKSLKESGKAGGRKKTTEQYKKEVKDIVGDEYIVLGDYKSNKGNIKMLHTKCGQIIEIQAGPFLTEGRRCPCCRINEARNRFSLTQEEFEKKVNDILGEEYEVIGKYINANTNIQILHKTCGYVWNANPNSLIHNGSSCPLCSGRLKIDEEKFGELLNKNFQGEYSVVEYNGLGKQGKFKHETCGAVFERRAYNLLNLGYGCPECNERVGEGEVRRILDANKIFYKREYKIADCKNIKPLPFDFAVFKDGELAGFIEYDGEQHYKPVDFFGGEEAFEARKDRDGIKNNYCKVHNIPLLRIPYTYTEDEVKKSVNKFLIQIRAVG